MSMIQGPTMANPEAFDTVADLRRELHKANDALFGQFFELARFNDLAIQMTGLINAVLLAHLQGNSDTIGQLLNEYLATREQLREKLQERIESDRIRHMH
ncbi:hypothetical protein [Paraburkholderia sp.]|uniref:hypothetical protein n=1 Tax=Paraburkholderia sp. TaxID=1926495 RepID=UPI003D6F7B68